MNIFNRVTWKAMWRNRTRTLVTIVGIILSAAMFTAVTTLGVSLRDYLIRLEVSENGDYFVQLQYGTDEDMEKLRQDERISQIGDYRVLGYVHTQEWVSNATTFLMAAGDADFYDMMSPSIRLLEGRLPQNSGEVVLPSTLALSLEDKGVPCTIGDTVTLDIVGEYEESSVELPAGEDFSASYTIVGISEAHFFNDYDVWLLSVLTYADGGQGDAIWHRAYVKTERADDAYDLARADYMPAASTHSTLLNYYGATKYGNYNRIILALCGVLMAIIMVGSVSLIYNAFSISVSERTKQFGLLSSIGATKKQLRRCVYFEAVALCAIGIPIGLLCGWGGIAVVLFFLRDMLSALFAGALEAGIYMEAVLSPLSLGGAAVVAVITVFLSAWLPARRATRVTPMDAIRQTGDFQLPKRIVKTGKISYKLWGLPGVMAKKYYSVSRKKYRTTVISLAVSLALFISAAAFAAELRTVAGTAVNTENFDIHCYFLDDLEISDIRQQNQVKQSAVFYEQYDYYTFMPEEAASEEMVQMWDKFHTVDGVYEGASFCVRGTSIYYLEDRVLEAYLREQGIDPEPYFDEESPLALVLEHEADELVYNEDTQTHDLVTYRYMPFSDQTEGIRLVKAETPESIKQQLTGAYPYSFDFEAVGERLLLTGVQIKDDYMADESTRVYYEILLETDAQGRRMQNYYAYNIDTGERSAECAGTVVLPEEMPDFRIGEQVAELPFGIPSNVKGGYFSLDYILPLSMAPEEKPFGLSLSVSIDTAGYNLFLTYLSQTIGEGCYDDYLGSQMQSRNVLVMIDVFAYGFIILISLICVCNVFNTISTNIALRRRDFGMLRSVGMKNSELYRMMGFECLRYGMKAILYGLPLGLLAGFGIHQLAGSVSNAGYRPPLDAIAAAVSCVFAVVFLSMFYAVFKMRKDNPIDAIRMENL